MEQGEGFKRIAVTPAEEEDEVILAGVSGAGDAAKGASSLQARAHDPEPAEAGPGCESASAEAPRRESLSESEGSREGSLEGSLEGARRKGAGEGARENARGETTLADLEGYSMPFAQRVIIIAAIVCIIGAVIYYLAFMR